MAALIWNVAGKAELSFFESPSGRQTKGPVLPAGEKSWSLQCPPNPGVTFPPLPL